MAAGFFAVFDDIAILLDDAIVMSKVATKKTIGVLGDDLAVGAEKASGFSATRELPVLWAISKGSIINKLIILPIAFLLSAFAPWAIVPILMLGGLYLAYEGAEKIFEFFYPHHVETIKKVLNQSEEEILKYEKKKVKSAILTDFILSIEIIILALSTVVEQSLSIQIIVVSFIALLATIGVYGTVALLVRMDDIGFKLIEISANKWVLLKKFGETLVKALPIIIKVLSVVGTLAMLLVAGGIYLHNLPTLHHFLDVIPALLSEFLIGLILGGAALAVIHLLLSIKKRLL